MVILLIFQNSGDWQPGHHMYHLSPSSSASISTGDQLNGQTLAGKSADHNVE
jgi:hypothetical protein